MRLGLPPANDDEMFNVCGSCGKHWKKDVWHPLACATHKGTWVTLRHDDMKNLVELIARKCGMIVRTEPRDLNPSDDTRVDSHVSRGVYSCLIDYTIPHPTSLTYLTRAAVQQMYVANAAAERKATHHELTSQFQNAEFFPFVVDKAGF
jgi:hypothetical protein